MRIAISVLVLAFILAEGVVYVLVGKAIGVLPTLGLVLLSMAAGVLLLRRQGLATVVRIRTEAAAGRLPAAAVLEGAALAIAALLMVLPGFMTDVAGLLLFVPAVRSWLGRRIRTEISRRVARREGRPPGRAVVELDRSQYAAQPQAARPRPDGTGPHPPRPSEMS